MTSNTQLGCFLIEANIQVLFFQMQMNYTERKNNFSCYFVNCRYIKINGGSLRVPQGWEPPEGLEKNKIVFFGRGDVSVILD